MKLNFFANKTFHLIVVLLNGRETEENYTGEESYGLVLEFSTQGSDVIELKASPPFAITKTPCGSTVTYPEECCKSF
jgi:hypothetical protein